MTFTNLNDKMNYYSEISKKTGKNKWDQDAIQNDLIEIVSKCNLPVEKLERIESFMVHDNATLDMEPSRNKSCEVFNKLVAMKKEEATITKRMVA